MKNKEPKTPEPFCFLCEVKPASLSKEKIEAGYKIALVFALFDSRDEATKQAVKLLTVNHWKVMAVKMVSPLMPFQVVCLDTRQKDCYKKAARERVAFCILESWPTFYRTEQYK